MASSSASERNGKGRKKLNMVKIENKNHLQVTFSKRRNGLFKKASEFCTLTGSEVGIVVCSPGAKVYSFGNPSVKKIMNKCFDEDEEEEGRNDDVLTRHDERLVDAHRNNKIRELNEDLTVEERKIEDQKQRAAAIREREKVELQWKTPTEKMTAPELYEMGTSLLALQDAVMRMKMLGEERVKMEMGMARMGMNLFPVPSQVFVSDTGNPIGVPFPIPGVENQTVVSVPNPDMRDVGMNSRDV